MYTDTLLTMYIISKRTIAWWCVFAHLSFSREQGEALPVAGKQTPVNPYCPASIRHNWLFLAAESNLVGWNAFSVAGGAILNYIVNWKRA